MSFHHSLSRLGVTAIATVALATTAAAQVVTVNNTGCQRADGSYYAALSHSGQPRLGQTIVWSYSCRPAPRSSGWVIMGFASGGGLDFFAPTTCEPRCRLYVAPIAGEFFVGGGPGNFFPRLPIAIPNDRALLFRTFSAQGVCINGIGNCFTLSGAKTMAIQP